MRARPSAAALLLVFLLPPLPTAAQPAYTPEQVVALGLENNPALLAQLQREEAARSASRSARLLANPVLDLQFGHGESYDGTITRTTRGVSLHQPLENPAARAWRIREAESEWRIEEQTTALVRLEITRELKQHLYRILMLEQRRGTWENASALLEEARRLVETRARHGEERRLEVLRLGVEEMTARSRLEAARADLVLARRHLRALTGDALPADFRLTGELESIPIEPDTDALTARALSSHPLMARADAAVYGAESGVRLARAGRLPDPELAAFTNDELHGTVTGFGISFALPLWNLKSREIAGARARFTAGELERADLAMEMEVAVTAAANDLRLAAGRIAIFREGLLEMASEALAIAAAGYRAGEIQLLEYLDAQRTHDSLMNTYYETLYEWNVSRAALEAAVGGEIR